MSRVEFARWMDYFNIHPYGPEWDDVRMAVLSANIVNALTGKPQRIADHIASYGRKPQKQSVEEQYTIVQAFAAISRQAMKAKPNG